jgi:hypothetical protein
MKAYVSLHIMASTVALTCLGVMGNALWESKGTFPGVVSEFETTLSWEIIANEIQICALIVSHYGRKLFFFRGTTDRPLTYYRLGVVWKVVNNFHFQLHFLSFQRCWFSYKTTEQTPVGSQCSDSTRLLSLQN